MPKKQKRRDWTPAEVKLLGTDLDTVIAKRIGCSKRQVQKARYAQGFKARRPRRLWTAEEFALLGTMSDSALAKRIGRTYATVRLRRSRLGIPQHGKGLPQTHWTAAQIQLFEHNDDARVVQLTGKKMAEVWAKRRELAN